MTQNNNFTDAMKMFINPDYLMNAMKQMPAPDFSHASESMKKNTKTLAVATQIATESAQSLIRRSAEIAQNHVTESLKVMQDMTSATNPEQAVARQQEFVKEAVENAIANTKEIIDMTSKSAMEMFHTLSARVSEDLNQTMVKTPAKK
jgi:phasin family protein